ncbi:MAG: hypothetical protein ACI4E3_00650 [Candidatus Fimousia sp.]
MHISKPDSKELSMHINKKGDNGCAYTGEKRGSPWENRSAKRDFYMEISMISALYPPWEMGRGGRPVMQVGRGRNGSIFIIKISSKNMAFIL